MPTSEINRLKKENKQLKALLKDAVGLLGQSRTLLASATQAAPPKKKARKKAAGKK
jgi:hypothetical protein